MELIQLKYVMDNINTICPIKGVWLIVIGTAMIWTGMIVLWYIETVKKHEVTDVAFRALTACVIVGIIVGSIGIVKAEQSIKAREALTSIVECKYTEIRAQE